MADSSRASVDGSVPFGREGSQTGSGSAEFAPGQMFKARGGSLSSLQKFGVAAGYSE